MTCRRQLYTFWETHKVRPTQRQPFPRTKRSRPFKTVWQGCQYKRQTLTAETPNVSNGEYSQCVQTRTCSTSAITTLAGHPCTRLIPAIPLASMINSNQFGNSLYSSIGALPSKFSNHSLSGKKKVSLCCHKHTTGQRRVTRSWTWDTMCESDQ